MQELSTVNINKSYNNRHVAKNISISIRPQEIVGLLGPNGAGKTTCFYIIAGLIKADSGKVLLNQQNISNYSLHKRSKMGIGYLPQESSIFRSLTVYENINAIIEMNYKKSERKLQVEKLLNEFHLMHIKDIKGIALSGGERRRVEIARAIATNPSYILLDEPFAGIDPISIIDIKRMIKQLADSGIGVLITDHNVRETLDICDRAYIAYQGDIIANGNQENIMGNENVRKVYLGDEFTL